MHGLDVRRFPADCCAVPLSRRLRRRPLPASGARCRSGGAEVQIWWRWRCRSYGA